MKNASPKSKEKREELIRLFASIISREWIEEIPRICQLLQIDLKCVPKVEQLERLLQEEL